MALMERRVCASRAMVTLVFPGFLAIISEKTGISVNDVTEILVSCGYRIPSEIRLPAAVDECDLVLLSLKLDGSPPWLIPDSQASLAHVTQASAVTGKAPREIVARLADYGITLNSSAGVPEQIPTAGRALLNCENKVIRSLGRVFKSWRKFDAADLVAASGETQRSPWDIACTLGTYGFTGSVPQSLSDEFLEIDREIISYLQWSDFIWARLIRRSETDSEKVARLSVAFVVQIADRVRRAPREVIDRLCAYGFEGPSNEILPDRVEPGDAEILSQTDDLPSPEVPAWMVALAAMENNRGIEEVVERLRAYGFDPPGADLFPRDFNSILLSGPTDSRRRLDPAKPVDRGHIAFVASRTAWTPVGVAARLLACGFDVPASDRLPDRVESADLVVLSKCLGGEGPWIPWDKPVPPVHIALATLHTALSAREIIKRLLAYGFAVPREAEVAHDLQRNDLNIVPKVRCGSRLVGSSIFMLRFRLCICVACSARVSRVARRSSRLCGGWWNSGGPCHLA
ncbi:MULTISPECIES: hypothetical protein [unclassified Pseudofrankia]|uniref:wHTH domain-containing protein n=1 Tax=unclassified Pseudofrankia TaxID=2994372 RepID=UPI001042121B|nr:MULTISPECIES: hypothetical protein [unclassified Pseudofrankia]MDT3442722.1 hypothetical protein [Pseudofrankia sp. BMG5.37]